MVALLCCALLAPLWLVAMFHRGLWTPDEPREADITWRMSQQSDLAVPTLAGTPFLEKPPLAYWAGAVAASLAPDHVAALRAPNFLFACFATLAVAALAFAGAGRSAAIVAALASGTFLLALQVASWLATDAAMMAGVACALLGFYRGFQAPRGLRKLAWYALMHVALAWAFLAKGPASWLVPVTAAAGLIVFERAWRELLRWELWTPFLIPLAVILAWSLSVAGAQSGAHSLAVLLWYNVAGRVVSLNAPDAASYAQAHRNWPGKYFIEGVFYLAPWTFLFLAAARRAWFAIREPDSPRLWRFAVCAWAVPLVALSFAGTGRGIYAAPTLPAAAVLIGLWFAERQAIPDRFERAMLRATYWFVAVIAVVLFAAAALLQMSEGALWGALPILLAGIVVVLVALARGRRFARGQRWQPYFVTLCTAFVCAVVASGWVMFPVIDRWQDISSVVRQIDRDTQDRSLALFGPDETTIALVDLYAPLHRGRWHIHTPGSDLEAVLVLIPGHASGPLSDMLHAWGFKGPKPPLAPEATPILKQLAADPGLVLERVYEVPHGRRYAVLAPKAAVQPSSTARSP